MQAVVKKVVYSFRYRLGPGQVGREVFYIVLRQCETHSPCVSLVPPREPLKLSLLHSIVFHIALRGCWSRTCYRHQKSNMAAH